MISMNQWNCLLRLKTRFRNLHMHHHHTGANNACEIHFHDLLSPSKQLLVTGLTKSMPLYRTAQHTGQCPYWLKDIAKDTNMLKCKKQRQEHTKFRTRKLQKKTKSLDSSITR